MATLDAAYAAWKRLGIAFTGATETEAVDVECLIIDSARLFRNDERFGICVITWLSRYHHLVDGRRLSELARRLERESRAYLGALLTAAIDAPNGAGRAPAFETPLSHCSPLPRPRVLYDVAASWPAIRKRMRQNALPIYRRWGFWHDDATLKSGSIHDFGWLLRVPELRARALCGPSVESACLALTMTSTTTAQMLAQRLGATYAATHAAVDRLVGRGLLEKHRHGVRQELSLSDFSRRALGVT